MAEQPATIAPASDPVTLQIVANALQSIADEMATTIIRTAHSTVVRDGMDFSSALCDARGETVAQAVSVPFHLGSIPTAMESLLRHYGDRALPGDVFIMNDPFDGGMHLQDIFVVKPVHLDGRLIGWAVTTAHHGDVGGRLPGSSACSARSATEHAATCAPRSPNVILGMRMFASISMCTSSTGSPSA